MGESFGEALSFTTLNLPARKRRRKPSLALDWEVEGPGGSFRLPSDSSKARKRPRGGNFSTLRGDGFGPGGLTLSREIFRDHADIGLLDTWRAISRSGSVAYEGRLHSAPRTNDPQEQIDIVLTGWATYLKSRKCAPLVVDRRFGGWGEPSLARRATRLGAGGTYAHYSASSAFDGVKFDGESGSSIPSGATSELVYDAGDVNQIAKLIYKGTQQNTGNVEAATLYTDDDPAFPSAATLALSLDGILRTAEPTTPEQYAMLRALASATHTPVAGSPFARTLEFLALYGNTGLTTRSISGEPDGVWLSDLITYIVQTFYPKIDTSAVEENSTLVQQADWHDSPSYGYDIIAELNKLALWEMNVWEDRKLHFHRGDLTRYDWQFRTDDPGVQVIFQGDSIENFANGVEVTYTDVLTGVKHTLLPPDHAELRDDSESNPANRHGENLWTDKEVPWQCTEAEALQVGRAYLPEYNRPKRPGSYTVTGHIEDGSGQWHAGWEPRCSQTVGILDHPEDSPRLITATSWDEESKQLRITVDSTDKRLEAIIARQVLASQAMNL